MNKVVSPLTGEGPVTLLHSIDADKLVSDYMKVFGIDIRKYLKGIASVEVYKCARTGYRFYYPFDLCGDGEFYSQLEKHDWYYMDTKWEHDETLKDIKAGDRVLEIGAARGSFLQRAMKIEKVRCVGLELNQSAATMARKRGVDVLAETAEEHAVNRRDEYDVICLFQVLEHISHPASLLSSAMRMLKRGGRLIIGVPDNSIRARSSIFVTRDDILNMPPHHMGLWDAVSLSSLAKIYPVNLDSLMVEPAETSNQRNGYRGLIKKHLREKYGLAGFAYYLAIRTILTHCISELASYLPAHTILARYVKQS